jgi:hypothetical protein
LTRRLAITGDSDDYFNGDTFSAARADNGELHLAIDDPHGFNGSVTEKAIDRNARVGSLWVREAARCRRRDVKNLDLFGPLHQLGAVAV